MQSMSRVSSTLALVLMLAVVSGRGQVPGTSGPVARGRALVAELGCASCHTELRNDGALRERTPDLSSAGRRYQASWLFAFLQSPTKVKQHMGRARMPGFHLSAKEALALTEFLGMQRRAIGQWPETPAGLHAPGTPADPVQLRARFQGALAGGLACLTCHKLDGKGGVLGIDLETVGYRLQPDWVREYLVAPAQFGVPAAVMPPQFFQLAPDSRGFRETTPRAMEKIRIVTDFLFSLGNPKQSELQATYLAAKKSYPDITPAVGEDLFRSLNCASCHRHDVIQPRTGSVAPDLASEGLRVNRPWLEAYLQRPTSIRPFGYRPGDGSRMPDHRLTPEEAADITAFLVTQKEGAPVVAMDFHPQRLTAFSQNKAKRLLTEKLSCLGCHRFGEIGGRIGPDLTAVGTRLQPDYLFAIIKNPGAVAPHSVMPKLPMPDEQVQLIASFLASQTAPTASTNYLSATDHALIPFGQATVALASKPENVRSLYLSHCAACHGIAGRGDGYNARYLAVKPTAHADALYLSTRPDDTLYDGIHAGGHILNRSHLMPAWGETLKATEIRELVGYIRTLCACQAPAWSRDNAVLP
jgi:mono/diheme cytochrome c family protein